MNFSAALWDLLAADAATKQAPPFGLNIAQTSLQRQSATSF
jgi:hypothetical protein